MQKLNFNFTVNITSISCTTVTGVLCKLFFFAINLLICVWNSYLCLLSVGALWREPWNLSSSSHFLNLAADILLVLSPFPFSGEIGVFIFLLQSLQQPLLTQQEAIIQPNTMRNQPLFRTFALCCTWTLGIESSLVAPFSFLSLPPSGNCWMDGGMGEAKGGKCVVKLQHYVLLVSSSGHNYEWPGFISLYCNIHVHFIHQTYDDCLIVELDTAVSSAKGHTSSFSNLKRSPK